MPWPRLLSAKLEPKPPLVYIKGKNQRIKIWFR